MNEEILHKYLNNECTEEELKIVMSSEEYRDYIKIADRTHNLRTPDYSRENEWILLQQKIKLKNKPAIFSLKNYKHFYKYAAVLAILMFAVIYVSTRQTTISTPITESKTLSLPDETEVILNTQSKIKYKASQWHKKRELTLDGEAYFLVSKGSLFDVITSHGVVSVVGTAFNVQSRGEHFHISCYEGVVQVSTSKYDIQLKAGNSVLIEQGELTAQQKITVTKPGWLYEESHFENSLLDDVLEVLKKQYEITVEIINVDTKQRFTGVFTHKNLDAALKTICAPLELNYTIDNNGNVTIYGQ